MSGPKSGVLRNVPLLRGLGLVLTQTSPYLSFARQVDLYTAGSLRGDRMNQQRIPQEILVVDAERCRVLRKFHPEGSGKEQEDDDMARQKPA